MTDSNYLGNFWGNQAGFVEQVSTPVLFPVTAALVGKNIELSWPIVPNAIRYVVYCGLSPDSLVIQVDNLQASTFSIAHLMRGQTYFVQVLAVFGSTSSISSLFASGRSVAEVRIPSQNILLIDSSYVLLIDDANHCLRIE